jgi:proteasome-associated ATPase
MVLDQEIADLRRKLSDAPKRMRALEERLLETKGQLAHAVSQNEKLSYTLARRASTSRPCARRSTS